MDDRTDYGVAGLIEELDRAVLAGDVKRADDAADRLYRLQGGTDADAAMPSDFPARITGQKMNDTGGQIKKVKRLRKFIGLAVAAALVLALCLTALAMDLFGIRDLVMKEGSDRGGIAAEMEGPADNSDTGTGSPVQDLIVLQGYPDSSEYKASEEWNLFCQGYDTDGSILNEVGNSSNEYTEKYPMYLVYSHEMAEKLEEITGKYGLKPHESMTVVGSAEELYGAAGTGSFLTAPNGGSNTQLGGYVYNDGTFHYDGEAVLTGKNIPYQFGNYVKGTFSDTCLNVGNADGYQERSYTTGSGVEVSLAISENKSLVIADLKNSFVVINVLTGSESDGAFGGSDITLEDLQGFADMFDFSMIP